MHTKLTTLALQGEVMYPTVRVPVPLTDLTPDRRVAIVTLIHQLATADAPAAAPSAGECRYCDVPATVCTYRVERGGREAVTDLF
jgi:hypothetical protein